MALNNNAEVQWQCPVFETPDVDKLAFLKRMVEDGMTWQRENCDQDIVGRAINILSGKTGSAKSSKWAKFTTGDLKRAVLEIIETLSDIRPYWGYATDNKAFKSQADMMSKVAKSIYLESFVDRALKEALQFAAITGAGFLYPKYTRSMYGMGEGQFEFVALGQNDVLPIQLPRDKNYQKAYIVTIVCPTGVAEAHARFPNYQQYLKPMAKKRYSRSQGGEESNIPAQRRWDINRFAMHGLSLEHFCDIYYTYVLDVRINYGEVDAEGKPVLDAEGNPIGKELEMGQKDTSWYYKVPYVGQSITRFENGREVTRAATEDDSRVYPNRRLMIHCDDALMYDGPAFDWHGMVPLLPFFLDEWAWEQTGYSLFKGTANTQDAIDDLIRSIYRVAMARANPGKAYNMDVITGEKGGKLTSRQAEALDPFDPGFTVGVDGEVKDAILKPPMPEWCYNVPEWVMKVVEVLAQSIQRQLGLDQIKSLEKLRGNVSDPEKLLDAEGPIVMGTSRSMERSLRDLGEMMKFLIIQYMPTGRIMQYVGATGIAPEVFDYAPDSVIPSHLPGEATTDAEGALLSSKTDPWLRAKTFAKNLRFFITPHSLHYIAQAQQRLNLLALIGKGVPMDPQTIAEQFDVPNWGSIDGATVKERVFEWAKEQLMEKAELAKLAKALGFGQEEEGGGKPGPAPGHGGAPPKKPGQGQIRQKGIASGGRVVNATTK
jgi:hypothetical protein